MKYISNTAAIDAVNEGRDVPKRLGDFRLKYVSTDGWRGYYDSDPTKKSGWVREDSDWVTGNWDDAGDHASDSVEDKLDKMADRLEADGREMIILFMPTSNVFSTCFDVYSRPKK